MTTLMKTLTSPDLTLIIKTAESLEPLKMLWLILHKVRKSMTDRVSSVDFYFLSNGEKVKLEV